MTVLDIIRDEVKGVEPIFRGPQPDDEFEINCSETIANEVVKCICKESGDAFCVSLEQLKTTKILIPFTGQLSFKIKDTPGYTIIKTK